jgi:dTMP kinase
MITPSTRTGSRHSTRGLVVVLVGIDGAGKTTAAHALGERLGLSTPTLVLANYSGRRTMTAWLERSGLILPVGALDLAESVIRSANVVANHLRARRFDGVVLMDRHLHCQQALRAARGLRRSRVLAAGTRMFPVDAVVFLDVSPEEAHRRITERGADAESLEDLRAYRDGYLALPGFAGFHRVVADVPLPAVLDDLEGIVRRLGHGRHDGPPRSGGGRTCTLRRS